VSGLKPSGASGAGAVSLAPDAGTVTFKGPERPGPPRISSDPQWRSPAPPFHVGTVMS